MSRKKKINVYLNRSQTISLYFSDDYIQMFKQFAKEKFGKASVSLTVRYLIHEALKNSEQQPESVECAYQNHDVKKQKFHRVGITLPRNHQAYIRQKAKSEDRSINSVMNEIIHEHMKKNPVLNNDDVEAVYKSNSQLREMGKHINELAKQFNAGTPQSISTQQIDEWFEYLRFHIGLVNKLLEKQGTKNPLDKPTPTGQ